MAAFSSFHFHPSFPLDSSSLLLPKCPSTVNNQMCALSEEPNNTDSISAFSQVYQPENLQILDQSAKVIINNGDNSVVRAPSKNSMDCSSMVTEKHEVIQKVATPMDKKRKCKLGSSANSAQLKDKKSEVKGKRQRKTKNGDQEKKAKEEKKPAEEAPAGYVHVRARRGQATDSHSLAERVRRERISEKMKLLQALVPGCDKVTGKALVLDEIITYVQSLQYQVEFLSMRLASVDPMLYEFGVDLESFMVWPDQDLSNLPERLPSIQEYSPTTANNYHLLENSANSIIFPQAQNPSVLPQGSRQVFWEVDEHRQKIINQSGFSNLMFSFP